MLAIYQLGHDGNRVTPDAMIAKFNGPNGFFTYEDQPEISLGANCSALQSLLASPTAGQHIEPIRNAVRFICDRIDSTNFFDELVRHVSLAALHTVY